MSRTRQQCHCNRLTSPVKRLFCPVLHFASRRKKNKVIIAFCRKLRKVPLLLFIAAILLRLLLYSNQQTRDSRRHRVSSQCPIYSTARANSVGYNNNLSSDILGAALITRPHLMNLTTPARTSRQDQRCFSSRDGVLPIQTGRVCHSAHLEASPAATSLHTPS